jgi:hypothetical protein
MSLRKLFLPTIITAVALAGSYFFFNYIFFGDVEPAIENEESIDIIIDDVDQEKVSENEDDVIEEKPIEDKPVNTEDNNNIQTVAASCGNLDLSNYKNIFNEKLCAVGELLNQPEITSNYWTWECANGDDVKLCNHYCDKGQIAANGSCLDITLTIDNYYLNPFIVREGQSCKINWELYLNDPAIIENIKCSINSLKGNTISLNSFTEGENSISFGISPNDSYSLFCRYDVEETGEYGQIQTDYFECQER